MPSCPVCNIDITEGQEVCPVCSHDLSLDSSEVGEWVILGSFEDQMSAGLARESLLNADIPAVLFSKSGFLGAAGLQMNPLYSTQAGAYEISVRKEFKEDATELLDAILDNNWHPNEELRE